MSVVSKMKCHVNIFTRFYNIYRRNTTLILSLCKATMYLNEKETQSGVFLAFRNCVYVPQGFFEKCADI